MTTLLIDPLLGPPAYHAVAEDLAVLLSDTRRIGGIVWLCGNGGSAEIANHAAVDLMHCADPPVRAISLCANTGLLTAIANDNGYRAVFSQQLATLAASVDVVVCLSVSGRSENIQDAVRTANALGCFVIGIVGDMPLPDLERSCDRVYSVWHSNPGVVEPAFSILWHTVIPLLREDNGREGDHSSRGVVQSSEAQEGDPQRVSVLSRSCEG